MRSDRLNLFLEITALLLVFGCVLILGVLAVAIFNIAGMELTDFVTDHTVWERMVLNPRGYLVMLLVPAVPIGPAVFAIMGIRLLLVRPEPPPWIDPDEEPP